MHYETHARSHSRTFPADTRYHRLHEKNDEMPDGTDAAETTAPEETTETGRASMKDDLPADFSLSGDTVTVITRDTYRTFDWDGGESKDSDVLATTISSRI